MPSCPRIWLVKWQTLLIIVPTSENARVVYLNRDTGAIAASGDPGRLVLGCSTIDIKATRDAGDRGCGDRQIRRRAGVGGREVGGEVGINVLMEGPGAFESFEWADRDPRTTARNFLSLLASNKEQPLVDVPLD